PTECGRSDRYGSVAQGETATRRPDTAIYAGLLSEMPTERDENARSASSPQELAECSGRPPAERYSRGGASPRIPPGASRSSGKSDNPRAPDISIAAKRRTFLLRSDGRQVFRCWCPRQWLRCVLKDLTQLGRGGTPIRSILAGGASARREGTWHPEETPPVAAMINPATRS